MTTDKILDKLAKLKAARDGEAAIGNQAAAEAFAAALNRLLLQHELSEDEVAYATKKDEPIVEVVVDEREHEISHKRRRVGWRESLAGVVARANLCEFLVASGTSRVWFCGTRNHAEVAAYLFAVLARTAESLCETEYTVAFRAARRTCARCGMSLAVHKLNEPACKFEPAWDRVRNYKESWLTGFIVGISNRFKKERETVAESSALVRLDNALARVNDYMKNKGTAASIDTGLGSENKAALKDGAAAADRASLRADALRAVGQQKRIK